MERPPPWQSGVEVAARLQRTVGGLNLKRIVHCIHRRTGRRLFFDRNYAPWSSLIWRYPKDSSLGDWYTRSNRCFIILYPSPYRKRYTRIPGCTKDCERYAPFGRYERIPWGRQECDKDRLSHAELVGDFYNYIRQCVAVLKVFKVIFE